MRDSYIKGRECLLHLSGIKKALRVPLLRTPGTTRCKSTLKTQTINFTKKNFIHPVVDPNYESIDQVQVQLVQFRFSTGNKVNSVNRESNKRKLHKYTCNSYRLYHSISCPNYIVSKYNCSLRQTITNNMANRKIKTTHMV